MMILSLLRFQGRSWTPLRLCHVHTWNAMQRTRRLLFMWVYTIALYHFMCKGTHSVTVVLLCCHDTLCNVTYCDLQFTWSYYSVSDVSNVMQLLQVLCTGTTRRGQYLKKRFRFVLQKHTCVFIPLTSLGDERGGHSLCITDASTAVATDQTTLFSWMNRRASHLVQNVTSVISNVDYIG